MKNMTIVAVAMCISSVSLAAEVPKAFGKMDANKDQKVTQDEFCAHIRKQCEKDGREYDEKKVLRKFAQRDVNGDKAITAEEYSATAKSKSKK